MDEVFGGRGIRVICREKLRSLEDLSLYYQNKKRDVLRRYTVMPEGSLDREILKRARYMVEIKEKKVRSQQYMWSLRHASLGKKAEIKPAFDVQAIKNIPIDRIIRFTGRSGLDRSYVNCPLHNEKTPSFVWYEKENRFHCFGCGEHGDIIDLVMKMNNIDFKQACEYLSKIC